MKQILNLIKFLAENKLFAVYVAIAVIAIILSIVGLISILISNMPVWMKLSLLWN